MAARYPIADHLAGLSPVERDAVLKREAALDESRARA